MFTDENVGMKTGMAAKMVGSSSMEQSGIAEFLKRPVLIYTDAWDDTVPPLTKYTIKPWELWVNRTSVKNKINNYAFIRGNLKIKVMVNASPFFYAAGLLSYRPLAIGPDNAVPGLSTNVLVNRSQRPHIWIYPQTCSGGEMTLPFLFNQEWLPTATLGYWSNMGALTFDVLTPLLSANGKGGDLATKCDTQIFAWMEDVELSGPTVALQLQAKDEDEYGTGIISKPASAVAAAAGKLKDVPGIGTLATAAQVGASAVSKISSLFGFSNEPEIGGTKFVTPTSFPAMAAVGYSSTAEKLTLDPKAELGVSSKLIGMNLPPDELNISSIVQRESFVDIAEWKYNDGVNALLLTAKVNPQAFIDDIADGVHGKLYMTPMCWTSALFKHWRGDIIYRFKLIASQYHKGRAIISFDPFGSAASNIVGTSETSGLVQTAILDMAASPEVEFRVPFQQMTEWLRLRSTFTHKWHTARGGTFSYNPVYDNGTITIRVFNQLISPLMNEHTSAFIVMSVRGAENLEFANPSFTSSPVSYFAWQSEDVDQLDLGQVTQDDDRHLRHFGEKITSLRELWQRRSLVYTFANGPSSADMQVEQYILPRAPPNWGFDTNGLGAANKLVSGFEMFNWTGRNPISWITPAFVGIRGGIEWTANWVGSQPSTSLRITRSTVPATHPFKVTRAYTFSSNRISSADIVNNTPPSMTGLALTNQRTRGAVSAIIPHQSMYRFFLTRPVNVNSATIDDDSDIHHFMVEVYHGKDGGNSSNNTGFLELYASAAADLMPIFFLNVPTVYIYEGVPTPV